MNNHTGVIIEKNRTDKVLERVGWILLIGLIGFTIYAYFHLPDTIPVHFNLQGKPNRFGNKSSVLGLCAIAIGLFTLFMFLLKSPHNYSKYNYSIKITPENKTKVYALSARLIRVIIVNILIMFLLITVEIFLIATGKIESTGVWSMILSLLLPIVPVVYYFIRVMRLK